MDEAERRFRACTDRFKRDLTKMILRSIDSMVRDAQRARAKEEALARKAAAKAAREARAAERAAEKAARAEAKKAERAAAKAARLEQRALARRARATANGTAEQLELQLELSALRPKRQTARPRMRADSILGAELADASGLDAPGASIVASVAEPAPPPKQPSERPLFVHKRARDGQIHALRRLRENASNESSPERDSLESS